MKRIHIYLMLITLVSAANTCTYGLRRNEPRPTLYLTQEFKDYTLFNEGSKWIYRLENNEEKVDTVTIVYKDLKLVESRLFYYHIEQYLTRSSSSFFNDIIILSGIVVPPSDFDTCYNTFTYEKRLVENAICFFTNRKVGEEIYEVLYLDFKETYSLEGKTYQDVKIFELLEAYASGGNLPRKTYYAKNIGLIRKELWNGQVWNLVDYEVSQ